MRIFSVVVIFLTLVVRTSAAQQDGGPIYPPSSGTAHFTLHALPGYLPESLEKLCTSSNLIVDAYVQSTFPPRILTSNLETDVVLIVRRVLKGPQSIREVVVAQRGGVYGAFRSVPTQYPLMEPGDRYILFLTDDSRSNLPDRSIVRRWITGAWVGMFKVANNTTVRLTRGTPATLRDQYDGTRLENTMADITSRCTQ